MDHGWIEYLSWWAAIATFAIAAYAYGRYQIDRWQKRIALEKHMASLGKQRRTITALVSELKMTESDILDALFRSKKVKTIVAPKKEGPTGSILVENAINIA